VVAKPDGDDSYSSIPL